MSKRKASAISEQASSKKCPGEEKEQIDNIYGLIEESVPKDKLSEVLRLLYGIPCDTIPLTKNAICLSEKHDFEIRAFKMTEAKPEEVRPKRIIRVGAVQNSILLPTDSPIVAQRQAIYDKMVHIISAAAAMGVNVLCLMEIWPSPFFLATREKYPWNQFSESAEDGPSTKLIQGLAKKYNMVIISPILERDSTHNDVLWNTAVVIGNNGNVIGKHRKNHIPRVQAFAESDYYAEGNTGHPVFETVFGKVAINICYGRHFAQNWRMFGLNGAEIVFNPSATTDSLSETLWPIEARAAAIFNSFYSVGINRVGCENYPREFTIGDGKSAQKRFGHFYGSSFVTGPNSQRTPPLSRTRDGLLVTEIDLNLCQQVKDVWQFPMASRPELYAESFAEYAQHDFEPQIIQDPSLEDN